MYKNFCQEKKSSLQKKDAFFWGYDTGFDFANIKQFFSLTQQTNTNNFAEKKIQLLKIGKIIKLILPF